MGTIVPVDAPNSVIQSSIEYVVAGNTHRLSFRNAVNSYDIAQEGVLVVGVDLALSELEDDQN